METNYLVGGVICSGEANANARDLTNALDNMRKGLGILEKTAGSTKVRFLEAELAYADVLDASGARA